MKKRKVTFGGSKLHHAPSLEEQRLAIAQVVRSIAFTGQRSQPPKTNNSTESLSECPRCVILPCINKRIRKLQAYKKSRVRSIHVPYCAGRRNDSNER